MDSVVSKVILFKKSDLSHMEQSQHSY